MILRRGPGWVTRRSLSWLSMTALSLVLAAALSVSDAQAATNASSAAAFIESAQNSDGGFAATYGGRARAGGPSDPDASLWATVALLAAGKNPQDERLNNGQSAQDYLSAHLSAYGDLTDLGLLAMVQSASGATAVTYGDPGATLKREMTVAALKSDPGGGALGVLGFLALKAADNAAGAAQALVADQDPDGSWGESGTDSRDPAAATALVIEALARAGVASGAAETPAIQKGLHYLHQAQINDGSIANSVANATTGSGDVPATAFTVQALAALHHPQLRTGYGESVLQGLADYQQQSGNGAGGLSAFGAYDTNDPPSVIDTAEAYAAFDGVDFPLASVPPTPPPTVTTTPAKAQTPPVNRASNGTSTDGVSAAGSGPKHSAKAYQGASAAGTTGAKPKPHHGTVTPPAGTQVTGSVVGTAPPPKLTSAAGRRPGQDHSALVLGLLLAVAAVLGGVVELSRPARRERSLTARALARADVLLRAFRARGSLIPAGVAVVGLVLLLLPVASGLWVRAPRGATLIHAFTPYVQSAELTKLTGDVSLMQNAFTTTRHLPALASFDRTTWPPVFRAFHDTLATVSGQRGHFAAVAALPSMRAFPWFLMIPGLTLLALAAAALAVPPRWRRLRISVAVIGIALCVSPAAFGLFSAGGQGAAMISAFGTVETKTNASTLQDGLGTIATGYGDLLTALPSRTALRRYPAVTRYEARWQQVLEDFTPLLGVMNDNLANYRAVAALPDFRAFSWFFFVPGLLILALALVGLPRALLARGRTPRPRVPSPTIEPRSTP